MTPTLMTLEILLPFGRFANKTGVSRIVAETAEGSFGLLPRRLDCVLALTPGILIYEINDGEDDDDGEVYVAVDAGVLIKTGQQVLVSVRRAVAGTDLSTLRDEVEKEFVAVDERELDVRAVMAKLEAGFLQRFTHFTHGAPHG